MRWAGRVLVVSALCALLCAPCSGWWGRQPSGVRDLDAVQKRAAELWKAANDTDADSVEATAKAASMNATATQAEDAAAYARRGSVFGKKPAPAEEVEALDFAAKQARALADTAQQRADALSRVARQARKRAGKADEVVEASQQTVEITKKLERSNVQLLEADNALQASEARLSDARAQVEKTARMAEERRREAETAQKAMETVQGEVIAAGTNATEKLFKTQKVLSATAKELHKVFSEAVKQSVEAQKKESMLAVEVATLQTRVIEAQHAISAMELELKTMQAIEAQFDAFVDSTSLEAKLAQLLSEKSALEQKVFNVSLELTTLNRFHHSERAVLEDRVANVTAEFMALNSSLEIRNALNESAGASIDACKASSLRERELESLAQSLNESCRMHKKNIDKLLAESIANETKRLAQIAVLTREKEEKAMQMHAQNVSFQQERYLLTNESRKINETLQQWQSRNSTGSFQPETTGIWKLANDTKDAVEKAQKYASAAHHAAMQAESEAAGPSILWRLFVSEKSKNLDILKAAAVEARNKFSEAMQTAQALERLHNHHDRVVNNLTQELVIAVSTIDVLSARANGYEAFLPDPIIHPRRWLINSTKSAWSFLGNLWRSSLFLTLFLGMAGAYVSQLVGAPKFALRFTEFLGVDFHVIYGLYVCFWLGNAGWSWGWLIFCSGVFVSTISGKRTKRIKAASCMAYRLPLREIDNRIDSGFDVEIHVIEGQMNKTNDLTGKGDPYIEMQVGPESKKTKVQRNTLTPKWDEKFTFHDIQDANVEVVFIAKDSDLIGKDAVIGSHSLRLYDILHETREGESSDPQQYFLRTTDMGMTKGFIMVSWRWQTRAQADFAQMVKDSNARRPAPENTGRLDAQGRRKYRFDSYWGTGREAEDTIIFLDKYAPGVTTKVAGLYTTLQSFNINPNGIHVGCFSFLAFLCGRCGLDVGYVIPLAMGLYKVESTLSAVLCRRAWEKRPDVSEDIRTKALLQWQQAFIPKENWLNSSQLWTLFQSVREEAPYWLREHETSWLNNLLGMFWTQYNRWISSYVANLIQSFVVGIADVEEVKAGSGFPKLINSVGSIAHPKDMPVVKDRISVTVVAARGITAQKKMSEMLQGKFDASCDPYVKIWLDSWPEVQRNKEMKKTTTKTDNLNPSWYETFEIDLPREGIDDKLHFEILDDDLVNDEVLAVLNISTNDLLKELKNLSPGAEIDKEYSMVGASKGKGIDIKIRLRFKAEIGIKYAPEEDSKRVFQLDTDLVWDTDLTIKIRKGVLIEVKIVSIRLPLRVTLEWLNYESQMQKCPTMSTCGNDFIEFRRQWQEWADNAHWPMPARIWLDLRSRPSLKTEIKSTGVGDVWKLPGMSNLQSNFICELIYNLFPLKEIVLKNPAPISEQEKTALNSGIFVDFMDSSKNGGLARRAVLNLTILRGRTDPSIPLDNSNHYCVIRYGKMLKLEPPLDQEILIDESEEHLRFSSTQWKTHDPAYADDVTFSIHDPGNDMIAFEMYRIDPKLRKDPAGQRQSDTLVLKHKFRLTEFIDNYGVVIYPRPGNSSDKKSLRRLLEVKDAQNPGFVQMTVIAQIKTTDSGNHTASAPALNSVLVGGGIKNEHIWEEREDVLHSCLEECQVGLQEGGSGCPGTLVVQLSAPSKQTKQQLSAASQSRSMILTLKKREVRDSSRIVTGRAVFHETLEDCLKRTRSTMGPIFHFEIPEFSCHHELEVSDGEQSVTLPLKKMTLAKDGYFEAFPKNLRPQHEAPDAVPFPAILAAFLPHVPKSMPRVVVTIHRVEGLPWYTGKVPMDAFCRVSVKKEVRPAESTSALPLKYSSYGDFLRARESALPVYDGGELQETGLSTERCHGQTSFNFLEKFTLTFDERMLHSGHNFHQVLEVDVIQVNEHGDEILVGKWRSPVRTLYLEFLQTRKISDEELATHGGFVGISGPNAFSLTRQKAPWTTVELEFEYQGNWMHVTEAHDMWWDKQEQAARKERGVLEAEACAKVLEEQAKEAAAWRQREQED